MVCAAEGIEHARPRTTSIAEMKREVFFMEILLESDLAVLGSGGVSWLLGGAWVLVQTLGGVYVYLPVNKLFVVILLRKQDRPVVSVS
jgi:hypothetical protein